MGCSCNFSLEPINMMILISILSHYYKLRSWIVRSIIDSIIVIRCCQWWLLRSFLVPYVPYERYTNLTLWLAALLLVSHQKKTHQFYIVSTMAASWLSQHRPSPLEAAQALIRSELSGSNGKIWSDLIPGNLVLFTRYCGYNHVINHPWLPVSGLYIPTIELVTGGWCIKLLYPHEQEIEYEWICWITKIIYQCLRSFYHGDLIPYTPIRVSWAWGRLIFLGNLPFPLDPLKRWADRIANDGMVHLYNVDWWYWTNIHTVHWYIYIYICILFIYIYIYTYTYIYIYIHIYIYIYILYIYIYLLLIDSIDMLWWFNR